MMGTPSDVTGLINAGNPREFTIWELAELIIEMNVTWHHRRRAFGAQRLSGTRGSKSLLHRHIAQRLDSSFSLPIDMPLCSGIVPGTLN